MTQMCMLHFHKALYWHSSIDAAELDAILQQIYQGICMQKLLKYSLVWQTYGKNKTVQFFLPHSVVYMLKLTILSLKIISLIKTDESVKYFPSEDFKWIFPTNRKIFVKRTLNDFLRKLGATGSIQRTAVSSQK